MMLIRDIESLTIHVGNIASGMQFVQFSPEVRAGEIEYVIPYIGTVLYERLNKRVSGISSESAEMEQVLDNILEPLVAAVANYAALNYTPSSDSFFSPTGLVTVKTDKQTAAFQYQKIDRMNKYAHMGDLFLDEALGRIERNRKILEWQEPSPLPPYYKNAMEFNRHYYIGNSRRTFLALLPIIERMDILCIKPALGKYYEMIQEACSDDSIRKEPFWDWLNLYVKPALANLVMSRAINELKTRTCENAVQLCSYYERPGKTQVSTNDSFGHFADIAALDAERLMKQLAVAMAAHEQKEYQYGISNSVDSKHYIIG